MIPGLVPIGGVIGWMKSFGGVTPAATDDYVECNGQTLNDPQSLLHGRFIPPLNSQFFPAFIRGSATSGDAGGITIHSHEKGVETSPNTQLVGGECYLMQPSWAMTLEDITPPYYTTVYMMRVK